MEYIGHNQPPSLIEFALQTRAEFAIWVEAHPVLTSEAEAREYKGLRDRVFACDQDLEAERKKEVEPHNTRVKTINDKYREPRNLLRICLQEGDRLLNDWISRQQAAKYKAAEKIRLAEEAAAKTALEKIAVYKEARSDAVSGAEADTVTARVQAERAIMDMDLLQRERARAEKEADEARKVHGGHKRAYVVPPPKEVLELHDPRAAIVDIQKIGLSDKFIEAFLSEATRCRKVSGKLPTGVTSRTEPERS